MRLIVVSIVCVAALVAMSASSAQIQNSECLAARTWHLQQSMKLDNLDLQEYHLNAAEAASQLANFGGSPCVGWKQWADGSAPWSQP